MKINSLYLVLSVLFPVILTGCGSGNEKKEDTWEREEPAPEPNSPTTSPNKPTAPTLPVGDPDDTNGGETPPKEDFSLSGNWASACLAQPNPHGLVFSFDGESKEWLHGFLFFRDQNCSEQYATRVFSGDFEYGEPDPETPDLIPMSLHVKSIKLILLDEELVKEFNKQDFYGYSDWESGKPKELVGRKDRDGVLVEAFSNYNYFKVDGDKAYLTEFADSPEERDTQLIENPLFKR